MAIFVSGTWIAMTTVKRISTGTMAMRTTSTIRTINSCSVLANISFLSYLGEFCFVSCPFHPPSILPISSIFSPRWIYFLLSSDFVSHSISNRTLIVSNLRIASLTQGCFSVLSKNVAIAIASIISINKLSIFWPRVYRWVLSNFV